MEPPAKAPIVAAAATSPVASRSVTPSLYNATSVNPVTYASCIASVRVSFVTTVAKSSIFSAKVPNTSLEPLLNILLSKAAPPNLAVDAAISSPCNPARTAISCALASISPSYPVRVSSDNTRSYVPIEVSVKISAASKTPDVPKAAFTPYLSASSFPTFAVAALATDLPTILPKPKVSTSGINSSPNRCARNTLGLSYNSPSMAFALSTGPSAALRFASISVSSAKNSGVI